MTTLEDLDSAIQTAAVDGVASVTVGTQTVVKKSLAELLEWRKQLEAAQAATKPGGGFRFQKVTPYYP